MMNKLVIILLAGVFLTGCAGEEKKEAPKVEKATESGVAGSVVVTPLIKKEIPVAYELLDSAVGKKVRRLDSLYGRIPYYTSINGKFIFYVGKGTWTEPVNGMLFNNLMGLVDENELLILDPEYNKIYNPDATVKGYIEIEKKGKRGLFDYQDGILIEPIYNVIFPSPDPTYIAIGKKGNDHFFIYKNGKEKMIEDESKVPTYISLGEKWSFDIKSKNIKLLFDTYATEGGDVGSGVVFTPSYLHHLGFLPEIYREILPERGGHAGIVSSEGKIIKSVSITDQIVALISHFYEEGVSGRDYQVDRHNIITVDSKNNVLGNQIFLESGAGENYAGIKDAFNFLTKNLLEVRNSRATEDYSKYDYMTTYFYYEVKENGEIEQLKSPRLFDCTKFAFINESYFRGYFPKHRSPDDLENEEEGNLLCSEHLDLEDLDLMRNEIYAEYGLIFKTEKWNEYFKKQSWYIPKYDNVDKFLTEKDKANIKIILQMKAKMAGKEQEFTQKKWIHFSAAG